jgi:hypothetical protein
MMVIRRRSFDPADHFAKSSRLRLKVERLSDSKAGGEVAKEGNCNTRAPGAPANIVGSRRAGKVVESGFHSLRWIETRAV